MQQVIRVYYDTPKWHEPDSLERVNGLLEEGWEIVFMQTFCGNMSTENGSYGVTFVLDDSKKYKVQNNEENKEQNSEEQKTENIKEESVQNIAENSAKSTREEYIQNYVQNYLHTYN